MPPSIGSADRNTFRTTILTRSGNEGRNGFRFIGRKVVIAAGDNMQLGIRHAAFEMEPTLAGLIEPQFVMRASRLAFRD